MGLEIRSKILNSSGAVHFILIAIEIEYYCCQIEFVLKPVFAACKTIIRIRLGDYRGIFTSTSSR